MATVMKLRVHELAKQLGTPSARVLEVCRELGIAASTAASGLDPVAVEQVRDVLAPAPEVPQVDPVAPDPPAPASPMGGWVSPSGAPARRQGAGADRGLRGEGPHMSQPRRRRLGFLPDWRVFTYVILGFNLLMVVWMIGGAVSGAHQAVSDCAKQTDLSFETCKAASNTGTGIGVALLFVFTAFADVILGVLWIITRPRRRSCPVCGSNVKKGLTACRDCGHDFRLVAQRPVATAGSWWPDPHGRFQFRWFDGQRWTNHVSSDGQTRTDPVPVA